MSNVGNVGNTPNYNAYTHGNKHGKGVKFNDMLGKIDSAPDGTGSVYAAESTDIQQMWDGVNSAKETLRSMVVKLLGNSKSEGNPGQAFWAIRANPEQFNIKVDDQTRAEAEKMIGEDGYYGVKQTTGRIMDFAKALAGMGGGEIDGQTIDDLRSGAQEAFDKVAKMFGGFDKMPEVTKKTYEAVMKEFDDWKANLNAGVTETAEAAE